MRRITPEEVLEAYRVTGMRPMQGVYASRDKCGCAIGVLAVAAGVRPGCGAIIDWSNEQFGFLYAEAFERGFDGQPFQSTDETRLQGYADGTAVREAVFGAQGEKS